MGRHRSLVRFGSQEGAGGVPHAESGRLRMKREAVESVMLPDRREAALRAAASCLKGW